MKQIRTDVAAGVITPAPGLRAQPSILPGIGIALPATPPMTLGRTRLLLEEENVEGRERERARRLIAQIPPGEESRRRERRRIHRGAKMAENRTTNIAKCGHELTTH